MPFAIDIPQITQKYQKQKDKEILTNQRNAKDDDIVDRKIDIKESRIQG